jgi:hypothetical protein
MVYEERSSQMADDAVDPATAAELKRLVLEHDATKEQIAVLLVTSGPRSAEYLAALTKSAKLWSEIQWLQRDG